VLGSLLLTITPAVSRIPLSIATPAILATFAYLDAKFHIKSDWDLIYRFMKISILGRMQERKDRLNTFYVLEDYALDKKHATKIFLKFKGQTWTYRQSYELILKHGTWMKQKYGIKKNEVVAIDFMNSETFIWVWFGLWSIGAKPAFINYNLTNKPLIHTIKTSTSRFCFAGAQFKQEKYEGDVLDELSGQNFREEGGPVEVVFFNDAIKAEIEATTPIRAPDSERSGQELKGMALLIYTSGTTGKFWPWLYRKPYLTASHRSSQASHCQLGKGYYCWQIRRRVDANHSR
jgi:acyl-CoA synthetase (AMP-forming)/AMP-acid ligase II